MPQKIKVHEKALAHLSRGLYRSPASALRELVSNAWDANATVVRINTNYPNFLQIVVEDNGTGFTQEEFVRLMEGGIGNSEKRPSQKRLINGRPIIGRLGIGMLGIAQICGAFTVLSKPRNGEPFRAWVRLYDLLKERLDADDASIVKTEEVDVGEYTFQDFNDGRLKYGTTIIADDVHPAFASTFQRSLKFEKFKEPSFDWTTDLGIVSQVRSLQELGDYWRLIWELSASCPVPYINENALPKHIIASEQEKLLHYDFKVQVDGIQLFKPVYLRNNPGGYTTLKIDEQTKIVYGKNLTFHGYIAVQEGTQLRPDELRGIMIRIKNVAIGYYDPSMLDYRFNEGPRSRWVTGEIYVDEGLENALNIDRDSFNRFHPEFRELQEYIHKILQEEIFPQVHKQIEVRSSEKAQSIAQTREKYLQEILSDQTGNPVEIKYSDEESELDTLPQANLVDRKNKLEVGLPALGNIKTKRAQRQLASSILAIYQVANLEKKAEQKSRVFTELLLKLLQGW